MNSTLSLVSIFFNHARFEFGNKLFNSENSLRPRLHYDATANTPLKNYYTFLVLRLHCVYVSSIETILCLHYNGVVCRSVLTTELYCVYTITEWFAVAY